MELQEHVDAFAEAGVRVIAVSPEPAEVIARFSERYGVTFPVLSDAGSAVINQYGIRNTDVPEDHRLYGMPFPGAYLTDAEGRIAQKHFNTNYRVRESAETIIRGDLGEWYDVDGYPAADGGGAVRASLGSRELKPFRRVDLLVRIDLPAGQHAYGEPVPDGLVATSVTVTGPEGLRAETPIMPATRPLTVHEEAVRPEWIDYNGHMNVAYYVFAFDHATDRLFDMLDLGVDYVERENKSVFQVECHVNYLQEVKEGDVLTFTIQLLDFDSKRIHFFSSMHQRDQGFLSATAEWLGIHVDLNERRSADLPTACLKRLSDLKAAHAALSQPPQIGRRMGIHR